MALCGVCGNECTDTGGIKCAGNCEGIFHLLCVKSDTDAKVTRSTKDWKCYACKNKSTTQGSTKSIASSSTALTKDFLIEVMEGFKRDVFEELSSFKTEMNDLSTSVQYVSDKLDTSNVLMEEIKIKFAELQKENQLLKLKNEVLSKDVVELRERMRNMEQYSRVKNIEISGLPVTKSEDINDLVTDVGTALGIEVKRMDIAAAHRVPSFKADREPSVIVQFTTRTMKEQWINAFRQNNKLTARDVNQHFPVQRVYVNDHLSPENKQFLGKLKKKGKELGFEFVWCRDCKFFVRKAEGDSVKRINTYEDMDKLK